MNKYYVYVYLDTRKPGNYCYPGLDICFLYEPFYVGKGLGNRMYSHLYESVRVKNKFKNNKIKKILKTADSPIIIKINDNIAEEHAYSIEIKYIASIGRADLKAGPLTNLTDGGDSTLGCSEHTRQKLKIANIGKKLSDATKEKIRLSKLGKISPKKGIKTGISPSKETREKISKAGLGRKHSEISIVKMSQAKMGHTFSQEVKNKMSETRKGKRLKKFIITSPSSKIFNITGLKNFCDENKLSQSCMSNVASGRMSHHKGWKCKLDK